MVTVRRMVVVAAVPVFVVGPMSGRVTHLFGIMPVGLVHDFSFLRWRHGGEYKQARKQFQSRGYGSRGKVKASAALLVSPRMRLSASESLKTGFSSAKLGGFAFGGLLEHQGRLTRAQHPAGR